MDGPKNGLGDIRLTAAIPLFSDTLKMRRHLAIRTVFKLPTGDFEGLLGSGGTDLATGLAYSDFELLKFMRSKTEHHGFTRG